MKIAIEKDQFRAGRVEGHAAWSVRLKALLGASELLTGVQKLSTKE